MSTPHNNAEKGQIAKTVLMPGDPLRAKFIAETFLENPKLVSSVRNVYATQEHIMEKKFLLWLLVWVCQVSVFTHMNCINSMM